MAENSEGVDKVQIGFYVPPEVAERFAKMYSEDYRKPSKEFEYLVNCEWNRRQGLKPPTDPVPSKRVKQSTN